MVATIRRDEIKHNTITQNESKMADTNKSQGKDENMFSIFSWFDWFR
jgi:hypothetical protein